MGIKSSPLGPSFNGRIIKDDANDRIYVTDSSNIPVALLGKDSAGNIVVKVAKSGQNVLNAPDNELIFNSQQDLLKVVDVITTSVPLSSGTYNAIKTWSTQVAHGQASTPAIVAFVDTTGLPSVSLNTGLSTVPGFGFIQSATNVYTPTYICTASVDPTYVTFSVSWTFGSLTLDGSSTINFKCYVLQETAT